MADKFIALEPLFVGTARAHNKGDEVPAENIERNGWGDMVAREGTKAAQKVTAPEEPQPVSAQSPAPK